LKRIASKRKAAIWLAKIRLKLGDLRTRWMGIMGLAACLSTRRNSGKETAKMASEAMTKGCDQGMMFPPRFWPVRKLRYRSRTRYGDGT
jgi:hypothetical protein